jgi:hypothetical protein
VFFGSCVLTAHYLVTASDVTNGSITNTGFANSDQTDPMTETEEVLVPTPGLSVVNTYSGISTDADGSGDVSVDDILEFTITATSTGTAALTDVFVSDDLTGTNSTCPGPLATGDTCILNSLYVVTTADLLGGTITNTGIADSDQTEPETDPATVEVPPMDVSQLTPTDTTCKEYVDGTALDFRDFYGYGSSSQNGTITYSVKRKGINIIFQVTPGVFFFYTGLSQTILGGEVFIKQTFTQSDGGTDIGPFDPDNNDIKLWLVSGTTCFQTKHSLDIKDITDGDITLNITETLPADGSYYVLSVKYDAGSVKSNPASGTATVEYAFSTDVGFNGHFEETDRLGIILAPETNAAP